MLRGKKFISFSSPLGLIRDKRPTPQGLDKELEGGKGEGSEFLREARCIFNCFLFGRLFIKTARFISR